MSRSGYYEGDGENPVTYLWESIIERAALWAASDGFVFKLNRYTWTRHTCAAADAERGSV